MTLSAFTSAFPHWSTPSNNTLACATISNITIEATIPIANATEITISYSNRLGFPIASERCFIPSTSSGYSNNYGSFSYSGGALLKQLK